MRRSALSLSLALPLLLASLARAEEPPPSPAEAATAAPAAPLDVAAVAGSQPARAEAEALSPELVQKLSAEQLVDVLKARERRLMAHGPSVPADSEAEEIIVPVAFFGCIALVVWLLLFFRSRRHAQLQETLRLMVEKGRDIPPELLVPQQPARSDLRRGILLVAIGVGVSGCLMLVDTSGESWGLGMIPLLIGVGYLVVWKLAGERTPSSAAK